MNEKDNNNLQKIHSLRHRLEYILFDNLKRWGEGASSKGLQRGASILDSLLFHALHICRKEVKINLKIAFPEKTEEQRELIARENYHWFSRFSMDVLHTGAWLGRTSEVAVCKNPEVLDQALSENKGVLLVSGHFGNWEVIPSALAELGYPLTMYVGRQTNPLTNELQNKTRASFGVQTIDKGKKATLQMGRALSSNKIIAMLVDQNDPKADLFVKFFGKLAATSKGASAFHLLRKSPVVLVTCPYVGDHLEMTFERIKLDLSGDKEQDHYHIAHQINSAFENEIRKFPEQYFWMHRRWRKRPPDDPVDIYQ